MFWNLKVFPTRQDYLRQRVSHFDYYLFLARRVMGVEYPSWLYAKAIHSRDEHMNDIPIQIWDSAWARSFRYGINVGKMLLYMGESISPAGAVCMLKASVAYDLAAAGHYTPAVRHFLVDFSGPVPRPSS